MGCKIATVGSALGRQWFTTPLTSRTMVGSNSANTTTAPILEMYTHCFSTVLLPAFTSEGHVLVSCNISQCAVRWVFFYKAMLCKYTAQLFQHNHIVQWLPIQFLFYAIFKKRAYFMSLKDLTQAMIRTFDWRETYSQRGNYTHVNHTLKNLGLQRVHLLTERLKAVVNQWICIGFTVTPTFSRKYRYGTFMHDWKLGIH